MQTYYGVAITDGENRKNHIVPLNTLINAYHDSWSKVLPMHLGHDRTKPIGLTKLSGIYVEPGKAYVTNESSIMETAEEHHLLNKYISAYDYDVFCSDNKEDIERLKDKLNGLLTEEYKVAPVGQAVAIRDKEIVNRLFPEWTASFKDGLVNARELQAVYSHTEEGEKGFLIPGVYIKDGFLLFAHYFFRRTLSILNTTNEEFFNVFEKVKDTTDVDIMLSLDIDMVGLPGTEHSEMEYQYIRGPLFNDDLSMIPEGVTCYDNEQYDNVFSDLLSTQFYWHVQDGKRTFECEELCDRENVSIDEGKRMLWGCRYVHSMLEPESGLPIHLDGAIRIYDEEQILERIDTKTDISKCGKNSNYKKLWRIDNAISIHLWKELISSFYRENALIGEYFGGEDKKYDAIVKANKKHNDVVKQSNDFSYIEFEPGDGIRFFLTFKDKFEFHEQDELRVCISDSFLCTNDERVKIMDIETVTLLKLLKRKGVRLKIPFTSLIDFNDMIFNFPILCCKDVYVVDLVFDSIKELCVAWKKSGDDRLISFGIRVNLDKDSFQVSFVGHINDLIDLFDGIPRFSDCSLNEWIESIYQRNNAYNNANDYPEKYKLINGDVVSFKRMLVPRNKVIEWSVENGALKVNLKLQKEEAALLSENRITVTPHFRIKQVTCKKCGGNYLQCDCIKFIDEGVTDEVSELDMFGLIWTNRSAYFPVGELSYTVI